MCDNRWWQKHGQNSDETSWASVESELVRAGTWPMAFISKNSAENLEIRHGSWAC